MRKVLLYVTLILCVSFGIASLAESPVSLSIDGRTLLFDDSTGHPYIDAQNRTMMPLRACLDSISCLVDWDQDTKSVITRRGGTWVIIPVGKTQITINEKIVPIDTAAVLKDGRTYLPLRAVFEAYKYNVTWNDETKAITATRMSKAGNKITILTGDILSGEVSNTFSAGGSVQHELTPEELKAFIDFFNSCDITEGDRGEFTYHHNHLSDSIDLELRLRDGNNMFIMAFLDGEMYVLDEHGYNYSLFYNPLQDYIVNTMGKYL